MHRLRIIWIRTQIVAISLLVGVVATELIARRVLHKRANTESRPYEPYFVSGDFYGETTTGALLQSREGPSAYGYRPQWGIYFNTDFSTGWNANRRSDWLFDHYLSRYSASHVDDIRSRPESICVFVIGGSVAVGSCASSKRTAWHALLETKLRSAFESQSIFVFNAAMGAFVSTQERLAFDLAVAPRDPDIVIVLNGFNDLHVPLALGVAPGDPIQIGKRYTQAYDVSFRRFVLEHSSLLRYLQKQKVQQFLSRYRDGVLANNAASTNLKHSIVNVYSDNMDYLLRRGDQMETPVFVFFQPWRSLSERQVTGVSPDPELAFHLSCLSRIRQHFAVSPSPVHWIDLTSLFNSREALNVYTDLVHFDDRGQEAMAEAIFTNVKSTVAHIVRETRQYDGKPNNH